GGDPGAVGEVGSSGDRLGPAGGRDLQDEGATAAASDTVPGALAVEGEAAGAGDRLAVDGTGAVGGAGQPVGGGAVRSTLGGDRRVDVRGEGDGTGQVSARACGAGRGRRRDEQCRGAGEGAAKATAMMRARAWFLPSIRWRRNLHDRHRGHARSVTCAAYRPPSPQVEPPTPNDFAGALGSRPHPADGGMGHRPSWRSSFVSDHGNPQLGDAPAGTAGPFKADELGPSRFKADIEAFDLA